MRAIAPSFAVNRRVLLSALASLPVLSVPLVPAATLAQTAPSGGLLPSWTDGPGKQAIYAYGPAEGLPDSKVGTFTQALYDEAKKDGWTVISMKNDWRRIFAFE
jgi:hypothetical protein